MFRSLLQRLLAEPRTRHLDLDSPETTETRRAVLQDKPFLRRIYADWYSALTAELPAIDGPILEIGSGAGFLAQYIPNLITSDVLPLRHARVALDAQWLPLRDASVSAIVMLNVLHHLPDVRGFLTDAARCVKPEGRLIMLEPWVSRWSRIVYGHFHHEPFRPDAEEWAFPSAGPLSDANVALPWIIAVRDRTELAQRWPQWSLEKVQPMMPFKYLLSGGMAMRSLMPGWTYDCWTRVESSLRRSMSDWAMFSLLVLRRT